MVFVLNLIFALSFNVVLVVAFFVSLVWVKKQRRWKRPFIFGVVVQGFALSGTVISLVETGQRPSPEELTASILSVTIAIGGFLLLTRLSRKAQDNTASNNEVARISTTKENITFAPEIQPSSATINSIFCRNCGAKLPVDSKFCQNCGTKVI